MTTESSKTFTVRRLNKNGTLDKTRLTRFERIYSTFARKADAEERARQLAQLNPYNRYVVCCSQ